MSDQATILERLKLLSTGERAALRRCAGQSIAQADGLALQALFHAMPGGTPPYDQGKWFCVLCIGCLWDIEEVHQAGSMSAMLRNYANSRMTEGVTRRMRAVLDARWDEDGYLAGKLARFARMLCADDRQALPDLDLLLKDLKGWNSDRRHIQIRWTQEYYQTKENE